MSAADLIPSRAAAREGRSVSDRSDRSTGLLRECSVHSAPLGTRCERGKINDAAGWQRPPLQRCARGEVFIRAGRGTRGAPPYPRVGDIVRYARARRAISRRRRRSGKPQDFRSCLASRISYRARDNSLPASARSVRNARIYARNFPARLGRSPADSA